MNRIFTVHSLSFLLCFVFVYCFNNFLDRCFNNTDILHFAVTCQKSKCLSGLKIRLRNMVYRLCVFLFNQFKSSILNRFFWIGKSYADTVAFGVLFLEALRPPS